MDKDGGGKEGMSIIEDRTWKTRSAGVVRK